ncbi:hypothetical protein OG879_02680 [Streptomyces caniferus]|uniref:hypothetical protein n=1 Tax=Streptomyces caniferus TaxID=285557 RepID=UPI002E2BF662|nr:hypothetical protein [Streptomyces caniferus]
MALPDNSSDVSSAGKPLGSIESVRVETEGYLLGSQQSAVSSQQSAASQMVRSDDVPNDELSDEPDRTRRGPGDEPGPGET